MSVHLEEVGVSRRFATVTGESPEPPLSRRLGAARWSAPGAPAPARESAAESAEASAE